MRKVAVRSINFPEVTLPHLSAPGGSPDSVKVDPITVYAAISSGFGGGGAGAGDPPGGWDIEREDDDEEPLFIDIEYRPTPTNCADARYIFGQAQQKLNEYNEFKNVFANEHVEAGVKIAAATAGVAASLGLGASILQIYNHAAAAAAGVRAAIISAGGAALGIGTIAVYIVLYIDRDRWESVVAEAKADKDRLCGPGPGT